MTSVSPDPDNGTQRESDGESSPELSRVEPRPVDEETSEDESEGQEVTVDDDDDDDDDADEENYDDEDDDDDEPKLKYARLTPHLSSVYRNGDMTSSFLVAGDKMITATHNGNIVRVSPAPQWFVANALAPRTSSNCRPSSRCAYTTPTPPR